MLRIYWWWRRTAMSDIIFRLPQSETVDFCSSHELQLSQCQGRTGRHFGPGTGSKNPSVVLNITQDTTSAYSALLSDPNSFSQPSALQGLLPTVEFCERWYPISEIKNKSCFQATESKLHDLNSTEHSTTKKTCDHLLQNRAATCYYTISAVYHVSTAWSSKWHGRRHCSFLHLRHLCEPSSFPNGLLDSTHLIPLVHIFSPRSVLAKKQSFYSVGNLKIPAGFLQACDWVSRIRIYYDGMTFILGLSYVAWWANRGGGSLHLRWGISFSLLSQLGEGALYSPVFIVSKCMKYFWTVDPLLRASAHILAYLSPKIRVIKLAFNFRLPMAWKKMSFCDMWCCLLSVSSLVALKHRRSNCLFKARENVPWDIWPGGGSLLASDSGELLVQESQIHALASLRSTYMHAYILYNSYMC